MIRNWNRQTDSGAIHAIGDGSVVVYGFGPEIKQVLAYPLSADSFCEIRLPSVDACTSERLDGTAIWTHTLENGDRIIDMVDVGTHCFRRQVETADNLEMLLDIESVFSLVAEESAETTLVFEAKNGVNFYIYPVDIHPRRYLRITGQVEVSRVTGHQYRLTFTAGGGTIYVAATPEAIAAAEATELAAAVQRVTAYWKAFLSQMKPLPSHLAAICENVAVMIKSQQAAEGAVLAGYNYHLAYVRDQYGVARGLLAMGFYREAEKLMYFYKSYFDEYGAIHNAQSIDHHGVFHIHENDRVEITGYLAVLVFSVYAVNHNEQFLRDMLPLANWCIDAQIGEMRNGMLPFNGDETYIAIGFLPRFALLDGSAEATMLLAESIRRYRQVTGDGRYDAVLEEIDGTYLQNFVRDGHFMTNIPERLDAADYPARRNGVCEDCGDYIVPLFCNENGRYVCEKCRLHEPLPPRPFGSLELSASQLMPFYVGSPLIPDEIRNGHLEKMVRSFREDGKMPSGLSDGQAVGYDYGLFLYALAKAGHPMAEDICKLTISVVDESGVWCEFYQNGIPYNTRCRPWESAINAEAIVTYYETYGH